jgi:hypothetical protein
MEIYSHEYSRRPRFSTRKIEMWVGPKNKDTAEEDHHQPRSEQVN